MYVLVDIGDGRVKETFVRETAVGKGRSEPLSYAEALIQQHTDIDATMNKLRKQLAACSIRHRGGEKAEGDIVTIFATKLSHYIDAQALKGSRARYRDVVFDAARAKELLQIQELQRKHIEQQKRETFQT